MVAKEMMEEFVDIAEVCFVTVCLTLLDILLNTNHDLVLIPAKPFNCLNLTKLKINLIIQKGNND